MLRELGGGGSGGTGGGGNQVEACYRLSMKSFAFLIKGIVVAGTAPLPLLFAMLNMKVMPGTVVANV